MPEPQLSVRGADVIEIAHRLAKKEGRTVRAVVTDALKAYEANRAAEEKTEAADRWAAFDRIAAAARDLAATSGEPDETEGDLYDEDGLPA